MPVCAVHAPCLLFTQRVWGTEPWGKLERSAEMAQEVGAEVVVVHPPFRWQREYARDFVNGIAALEELDRHRVRGREHVSLAGVVAARHGDVPAGMGPLGRAVRQHHDRPLSRRDRAVRPDRDGRAARRPAAAHPSHRRQRLRQGRAPGAGARGDGRRARSCDHLADVGFGGEIVVEINTRRCSSREERERDLRESLDFAREHFAVRTRPR